MRFALPLLVALAVAAVPSDAQRSQAGGRRATTIQALLAYPTFFHTQSVRVRGVLDEQDGRPVLRRGETAVAIVGRGALPGPGSQDAMVEATGVFVDVGRLEPGDPRLHGVNLASVWSGEGRAWPGVGELPLVVAEQVRAAEPFAAPTVRALALEPWRYVDQRVTVTGRFRGLNLYGDLPAAPQQGRWAFVLQSADAAVWVVGVRPRGRGFTLDVNARVDTGRSLEVSGTVSLERGVPVIEGQLVALSTAPAEAAPSEPVARVPAVGPAPEVVFSLPTQEETAVSVTTGVRIQFSRDIDPRSLGGEIAVTYVGTPGEQGAAQPPSFTTQYDQGLRVLEIRFAEPLASFRTVRVDLGAGIKALDGAALVPWTLTFSVGS